MTDWMAELLRRRGCLLIAFAYLGSSGCYNDYSPLHEKVDSPSTLSVEEEDKLIERGQEVLRELDLAVEIEAKNATKSVEQMRAEAASESVAVKFEADPIPEKAWIASDRLPLESWEVQYLGQQPIGFLNQRSRANDLAGESRIITEVDSLTRGAALGSGSDISVSMMVVEASNGLLKSLDYKVQIGDALTQVNALVVSDQLKITVKGPGQNKSKNVPWKLDIRGPMGVQQSLQQAMMKIGETRKFRIFDPTVGDVTNVVLSARGNTRVPLADGTDQDLIEIEQVTMLNDLVGVSTLWVDSQGTIQKRYLGGQGKPLLSMRVTPDVAANVRDASTISRLEKQKVDLEFSGLEQPGKQSFRVTCVDADPYKMFVSTSRQKVVSVSAIVADVTVESSNDGSNVSTQAYNGEAAALASTYFINTNSPDIQAMVTDLQANAAENRIADIVAAVRERVTTIEFDQAVSSPARTLQSRSADCVDTALLTASISRGLGIPTRIAFGLTRGDSATMDRDSNAMYFHAWARMWIDGAWGDVDATQADGVLPLATLQFMESDVASDHIFQHILPIYQAMQTLELSIR